MADNRGTAFSKTARLYCLVAIVTFAMGLSPVIFNLVVDPYEMNAIFDIGLEKKKISEKAHYPLWKFVHYPDETVDVIILGDSRARAMRDKYWHEVGVGSAYNFAYGGATLYEIYDTFQHIKDNIDLKTLIVGTQLRSFKPSRKNQLNRVPEAIQLSSNPLDYYSNWFVSRIGFRHLQKKYGSELEWLDDLNLSFVSSAFADGSQEHLHGPANMLHGSQSCIQCTLPSNVAPSEPPSVAKEEVPYFADDLGIWGDLWPPISIDRKLTAKFEKQIRKNAKSDWRSFEFSEDFWSLLVEISAWCKQNDVQLIFVIPPTIAEMQSRITEFGYGDLNHEFRKRLVDLGVVVDFDFDNQLTRKIDYFTDAYHSNSKAARQLVGEIAQLVSQDKKIVATARKRRKDVICPISKTDISNAISDDFMTVLEGKSCRIWRKRDE